MRDTLSYPSASRDLGQYRHWQPYLHDLGECKVKHGEVISLVNLYNDEIGNAQRPTKLALNNRTIHPSDRPQSNRIPRMLIAGLVVLTTSAVVFKIVLPRVEPKPASSTSIANVTSSIPEKSIAVLPFENLSANQETAFFTDGVQDEILSNLAKVADLKVISRTSVMQYKVPRARNLREIGRQLGVAHVLEGSVQRAGNRVRINAQLIDARTDAHLWAQVYDRELADVFAIQSEIARAIADQLQARLSAKEEAALNAKPTDNVTAYDLYLQAIQITRNRASSIGSGNAEEAKRQISLLDEAIRSDPAFVPAICALADNHLYLHWMSADQSVDHLGLAKHALEAATRLQPRSPQVHLTRALLHYWGAREYTEALSELSIARRDLPNDIGVLSITAMIERRQGSWQDSTKHLEQALTIDPGNVGTISELCGFNYLVLRRYADSIRTLDHALAWNPLDFNLGYLRAFVDFVWRADLRRWRELVESEATTTADPNDVANARIDLALKERDYYQAEQLLESSHGNETDDNGFFTPWEWKLAIIARGLGQQSKATGALRKARERVASAVQAHPSDAKVLIVLGQVDAALGHKKEALDEGQRAVELLPVSRDEINGHQLLTRLVMIDVQVGEIDRALASLEEGISQPCCAPAYGSLRLDEVWDPLRGNPRFEKILATLAPKP